MRLKHYLKSWLVKSKLPETYEGLTELVVSNAYFASLNKETQTFLKEQGLLNLEGLASKAENYLSAHPTFEIQNNQKKKDKEKWHKNARH